MFLRRMLSRVVRFFARNRRRYGVSELADLQVPEFYEGDLLCHPKGRTLIVLSVHPPGMYDTRSGQFGTEYTVLTPEGTFDRISGSALANWRVVAKN